MYENVLEFSKRTVEIKNWEKKKMFSHQDSTVCYICKRKFTQKLAKNKNYCEVKNHCSFTGKYRGAAHNSKCNLRFNLLNELPAVFHNRLKCHYHFIIRELANKS